MTGIAQESKASTFAASLRAAAEPDWTSATTHRFVRELASGEIDDAAFARYLRIDYGFIETLVTLVAHAVATAPGMDRKKRYAAFLGVLTGDENDYFERSFAALKVPAADWRTPIRHPVLDGFRDLMARQAQTGCYGAVLAALLPVEWVYLTWASAVADAVPGRPYLREWIDLHIDPGFADFVTWMTHEMDDVGQQASDAERDALTAAFTQAVALEVQFFDAVYAD